MYTFSDFEKASSNEKDLIEFIDKAIDEHINSPEYKTAMKAKAYYKHRNPDIEAIEHIIYDMYGAAHIDSISPNHKLANGYYPKIINQGVAHLLGNGISFKNPEIKKRLGPNIDGECRKILTDAKNSGVSYGFYNGSRVVCIPFESFKPIYDDYNGDLRVGIKFTQIDKNKPMSIVLYEADGFSEFERVDGVTVRKTDKTPYRSKALSNRIEGEYERENDSSSVLPIYPLYNIGKQSDIVGNLNILIAIDIVNSNLVNNVSQGELIYWVLKNNGGMDEVADANFIANLIKRHVIHVDEDGEAQPHQITVPFEANQTAAAMLKRQLYDNMDGVLTETLNAGNLTATAINSAYSDLRQHSANMEYEMIEFLHGLFRIIGIPEDEEFSFTYYETINQSEMIENILACQQNFDDEEITRLLCSAIGNIDNFESIQKRKAAAAMARAGLIKETESESETE